MQIQLIQSSYSTTTYHISYKSSKAKEPDSDSPDEADADHEGTASDDDKGVDGASP